MAKETERSMVLMDAGLVNEPSICIKDFGSTFACVCPKCTEERMEELQSYLLSHEA